MSRRPGNELAWNHPRCLPAHEENRLKIKNERDFWSELIFIAVGIAFASGSTPYPLGGSAKQDRVTSR